MLLDAHFNEVYLFVHAIKSERFEPVHPELFLIFFSQRPSNEDYG
jgi:hypothetical protein